MRRSLSLFLSLQLPLPPPSPPCTSRLSYQLCALSLISSLPDKATRSGPIVCQQRRHFVFVLLSFLCFLVLDAGLLPFIVCVPPAVLLASCDNPPNQVIYIRHANTCTFMYMHAVHTELYTGIYPVLCMLMYVCVCVCSYCHFIALIAGHINLWADIKTATQSRCAESPITTQADGADRQTGIHLTKTQHTVT